MTVDQKVSPVLAFEVEVFEVERLSPAFARLTFRGESLRRIHDGGRLGPRDTRIKVLVPQSGREPVPVPDVWPEPQDLDDVFGPGGTL